MFVGSQLWKSSTPTSTIVHDSDSLIAALTGRYDHTDSQVQGAHFAVSRPFFAGDDANIQILYLGFRRILFVGARATNAVGRTDVSRNRAQDGWLRFAEWRHRI